MPSWRTNGQRCLKIHLVLLECLPLHRIWPCQMKIPVFWNMNPYGLVYRYQHFGGELCTGLPVTWRCAVLRSVIELSSTPIQEPQILHDRSTSLVFDSSDPLACVALLCFLQLQYSCLSSSVFRTHFPQQRVSAANISFLLMKLNGITVTLYRY